MRRSGATRRARAAVLLLASTTVALGVAGCSSDGAGSDGAAPGTGATTSAAGSPAGTGSAGPARTAGTYLSLGDSYAQGYQPAPAGGTADYREGYAYLLPERAAAKGWDLDLVNLACGGATVGSMQDAAGCAAPARSPDGPAYDVPQLEAATTYLADHPGEVALVTVSIGGNDITRCARAADPIPCVTEAVGAVEAELADILPALREAAGPDTTILGLTYPDVILGAYVSGGPAQDLAELSVVAFEQFINPMLRTAYEGIDATFVDVTAGTGAYTPLTETTTLEPYGEVPEAVAEVCRLTWFCERQDIHPRAAGYDAIADLIVAALPPA